MDVLFEYDEHEVIGIIGFLDPEYPTTVWYPGADGFWQLCVQVEMDGTSYYDWVDDGFDPGDTVRVTVRRRRLRLRRKWTVISGHFDNYGLRLQPVVAP